MTILGVDEAGRGPIIGPLCIAAAMVKESDLPILEKLQPKDSKLLKNHQIHRLATQIKQVVKYKVIQIQPAEIDAVVDSDDTNLNWLEADKTAELLNSLKPKKAILDCPSPNIAAYKNYLKHRLKHNIEIIAEHKAEKYAIVAAASIIAKSEREKAVEELKKKYGNIGSGYPSDPTTKEFLKNHWKQHAGIFRRSWITYKRLVEKEKNKTLSEF